MQKGEWGESRNNRRSPTRSSMARGLATLFHRSFFTDILVQVWGKGRDGSQSRIVFWTSGAISTDIRSLFFRVFNETAFLINLATSGNRSRRRTSKNRNIDFKVVVLLWPLWTKHENKTHNTKQNPQHKNKSCNTKKNTTTQKQISATQKQNSQHENKSHNTKTNLTTR